VRNSVPRAVLETNVLVPALISPGGGSARLLLELRSGAFEFIVSPLLLAEPREVLRRDKFRRYVSEAEADACVELIRTEGVIRACVSNAFVPVDTLPDWLQTVVHLNPISLVITALRDLMNNAAVTAQVGYALLGFAIVVAVFLPLTVRSYSRKVTSRTRRRPFAASPPPRPLPRAPASPGWSSASLRPAHG